VNKAPKKPVRLVEAPVLDADKMARKDPVRWFPEKEFIENIRKWLNLDRPLRRNDGSQDLKNLTESVL